MMPHAMYELAKLLDRNKTKNYQKKSHGNFDLVKMP